MPILVTSTQYEIKPEICFSRKLPMPNSFQLSHIWQWKRLQRKIHHFSLKNLSKNHYGTSNKNGILVFLYCEKNRIILMATNESQRSRRYNIQIIIPRYNLVWILRISSSLIFQLLMAKIIQFVTRVSTSLTIK